MSAPAGALSTQERAVLSPRAARRVFLTLTFTRWFPIGLVIGVSTLWQLEHGLSIAEVMSLASVAGLTVFALELPTSGFADAAGRRPVLVAAALVNVVASVATLAAQSYWMFLAAALLTGVFRALDSGPLEAWYVDTVHLTSPGADVDDALSAQGAIVGGAIAVGALLSGGLVWWHPVPGASALMVPVALFVGLNVVHLAAVAVLLREEHPRPDASDHRGSAVHQALASGRQAPGVVRDGLRLLRGSRVLLGIVLVELFWSLAMVVFEGFQPIRLAELVGGEEQAGAIMGPVAAGGWAVFAVGSALAGWSSRRIGVTRTAMAARVLNGLGAVAMGLAAGPVGLVSAYAVTYLLHGAAGPMHGALLHREARAENRATVLSMNSMFAFAAFGVAAPLVGLLAERTSTQVAMVAAGALSILGVLCYLPALRAERDRAETDGQPSAGSRAVLESEPTALTG
ncbi:MFS transporter [Intrasporangium oryzae NRRL B-24470]|uniref:MFS transporter n=1 Tax=Intrasporangium oryzae NRRL B-24470 TaxID=1386089 RepID=W9GE38_9MICO|nr:MFS transporter [Intrasporangium oryzae]EWT03073.1 MFS transporter [Intrasporangium oryzae NRRL B-24470]